LTYVAEFDIDANLHPDIIPRGCEVRQARQSCLCVPNAKGEKVQLTACLARFLLNREFGTSNDVALSRRVGARGQPQRPL
jgi:hypothetical protein